MKWLSKKVTNSTMDVPTIMNIKEDLEKIGSVHIQSYKSRFSILFPEWGTILESNPATPEESNHIEFLVEEKKAIQFCKRFLGFSGCFFDESFSQDMIEKIELILAKHGYYTNTTSWKFAPWRPLIVLAGIVLFSLLSVISLFIAYYFRDMPLSAKFSMCLVFSMLIYFIYLYMHLFHVKKKR